MGGKITTSGSGLCAFNKCELFKQRYKYRYMYYIDSLPSTWCVEWEAPLQRVTGSSLEGEHKAHGHSCIAISALCTGNHDLICTSFEQALEPILKEAEKTPQSHHSPHPYHQHHGLQDYDLGLCGVSAHPNIRTVGTMQCHISTIAS